MQEGADGTAVTPDKEIVEAELDSLRKEIQEVRQALDEEALRSKEYLDMAKRIQADFDNYKKRNAKEKEELLRAANDKLVCELLSTLDDLERAVGPNMTDEQLRTGLAQIITNLRSLLKGYGLREIPAEEFDPLMHEAFGVGEGEDGRILEVYQKGYCIGPRVIRHSKVKVGKRMERGDNNG